MCKLISQSSNNFGYVYFWPFSFLQRDLLFWIASYESYSQHVSRDPELSWHNAVSQLTRLATSASCLHIPDPCYSPAPGSIDLQLSEKDSDSHLNSSSVFLRGRVSTVYVITHVFNVSRLIYDSGSTIGISIRCGVY